METNEILSELRKNHNLTQDEMAEKLFVTRQAVSRWENGETTPNPETLKLISKSFDISINTLLGSPRQLKCQCCGMPLDDGSISMEKDDTFNEDYCKWCYSDGEFVYKSFDEMLNFLASHMSNESWPEDQVRAYFSAELPKLKYWQGASK